LPWQVLEMHSSSLPKGIVTICIISKG
jgi:hypothetical protein